MREGRAHPTLRRVDDDRSQLQGRLLDGTSVGLAVLAITVGLVFHGAMYGPQAAYFAELFGTKGRYTGMSVGSQLASLIAGAPAPIIAVALLGSFTDPDPSRVAIYIAVCSVITVAAVLAYSETSKRDLAADDALEPEPATARA